MHSFETTFRIIGQSHDEHPQFRVDLHGTCEHLQAFKIAAALIQKDQIKGLLPNVLHSAREGRRDSYIATQIFKNGPVANEFPTLPDHEKDSGHRVRPAHIVSVTN